MEIDFMILRKSKIPDNAGLLSVIKDILKQLFTDVKNDYIIFTDIDNNVFEMPYKCSESNKSVYLKIEYDCSEAKAAKILSIIRDNITQEMSRTGYSAICTFDEASLSYCCRLMRTFGKLERRLRELLYLITVKAYGIDWIEKSFPEEIIAGIKSKTGGKITEAAFEMLDYGEIQKYLFDDRFFEYTAEQVIDEELTDEKLNVLSKDEIINFILKARKDTLWNKLFAKNKNIVCIKEDIDSLRKYRNDIMYHHTLNQEKFNVMQSTANSMNKKLKLAIDEIEDKIYTEMEYGTIFSVTGNLVAGVLDKISEAFNKHILDINKVIGETIIKLSENILNNIPDYSNILKNALSSIKFPDYSKALGKMLSQIDTPKYLNDMENVANPINTPDYLGVSDNTELFTQMPDDENKQMSS